MGSNQQGFWEMREQSLGLLVTQARCIKLDMAYLGLVEMRMEELREDGRAQEGERLSECSLSQSVPRCSKTLLVLFWE